MLTNKTGNRVDKRTYRSYSSFLTTGASKGILRAMGQDMYFDAELKCLDKIKQVVILKE